MRIEICGGIASGKTTLCQVMERRDYCGVFENFHQNPFWSAFYRNPKFHAFETEITFLLQHYSQIKIAATKHDQLACDFAFLQDRAYAEINLLGKALSVFDAVHGQVLDELSLPSVIVHLCCGAEEEFARIKRRGRAEERGVEIGYLDALNRAIANHVTLVGARVPVVTIDSVKNNFATDTKAQDVVLELILNAAQR